MTVSAEMINTGNWIGDKIVVERIAFDEDTGKPVFLEETTLERGERLNLQVHYGQPEVYGPMFRLRAVHPSGDDPNARYAGEVEVTVDAKDEAE